MTPLEYLLMWTLILWVIIGILHLYDRLTGRDIQQIEITLLNKQEDNNQ